MANGWYQNAVEAFARKEHNWETDTIKAYPVGAGYTVDLATHDYVLALGANVVGTPIAILNRAVLNDGVLDGDDVAFTDVANGTAVAAVVVAVDSGAPATSRLLLYFDTGTNFPITSIGQPISVTWDNGANRIAKL